MKRALVTGHRGFIGSHAAAVLDAAGYKVSGIDLVEGNDALDFFRQPDPEPFDLAWHCAAFVGGRQNIDNARLRLGTNLALDSWFLY
jgi:nucleoside-diphosphate-sugar epimerase